MKPQNNVFRKGVDGQKAQKKWNFEREDKRKTTNKTEQEEKKDFNKIEEKTLKLQEIAFLGRFAKQKHKNTEKRKQNHKKTSKKNTLHFGKQPPILGNFFLKVTLLHVCKAALC